MKKMITAVAAILISVATFAQTAATKESPAPATKSPAAQQRKPISPEDRGKRETEQMNALVPLGDAYNKVLAVNTDFAAKRQATKSSTPIVKDQTKEEADAQRAKVQAEMKELNKAHKKELETAMGADLYAKYQAALKAKREERKEMREQKSAPAPAEKK